LFSDPDTNERDHAQQRAFEVIVSMFILTFYDEAEQNEGKHNTGTAAPELRRQIRAPYRKLKKVTKNDGNETTKTIDHVHGRCRWKW